MKNLFKISFVCLTQFFASCFTTQEEHQLTTQEALRYLDSTQLNYVLAGYKDTEGYSFLSRKHLSDTIAVKLFCNPGFPDITDTLVEIQSGIFKSIRNRTLYQIQANEVTVTYFQKIIHPSSNWQGQTPWQEINIIKYRRIDKNLRP
ncbi:hypothetical protein CNR22_15135 [Sphingobacteriaceae bacterium]|nr:hypothetical protein CNR22_15135 [Sphingobacteriaceae bacterium]